MEEDTIYVPTDTLPSLDFYQHEVHHVVRVDSTHIMGKANFSNCKFFERSHFSSLVFHDLADLSEAKFYRTAFLGDNQFNASLDAHAACFFGSVLFRHLVVNGEGSFSEDSFYLGARFWVSTFKGNVSFEYAYFKGFSEFRGCSFRNVSFRNCIFTEGVDFSLSGFHGNLDFSNSREISGRIDLTHVLIPSMIPGDDVDVRQGINLTYTDPSKFKLDYRQFRLIFDGDASFEDKSNVYQGLLNTFKNDGYTESYELLDKEYKTFLYNHKGNYFGLWLDKYWWDFGYSKYYVFYWMAGMVLFFTLINLFLYPFLDRKVYTVKGIEEGYTYRNRRRFFPRCYHSLVYTSILFFSVSVKLEKLKYKYWYGVLYIFIIYLLGLVCLAYAANFVLAK